MLEFMSMLMISIIVIMMILKVFIGTTEEGEPIEVVETSFRVYDISGKKSCYIVRCEGKTKKLPKEQTTIEHVESEDDMRLERVIETSYNVRKRWFRRSKMEFHQFSIRYVLYLTEERIKKF